MCRFSGIAPKSWMLLLYFIAKLKENKNNLKLNICLCKSCNKIKYMPVTLYFQTVCLWTNTLFLRPCQKFSYELSKLGISNIKYMYDHFALKKNKLNAFFWDKGFWELHHLHSVSSVQSCLSCHYFFLP